MSSYHHIQRAKPELLNNVKSFNEFIQYKFDPARPYSFHFDIATKLQTDHLIDLKGNIIVDFIGRYESLHDDVQIIKEKIGLKDFVIPHKRKANDRHKNYQTYYNDESIEAVAKHYQQDITLLNYQFE